MHLKIGPKNFLLFGIKNYLIKNPIVTHIVTGLKR